MSYLSKKDVLGSIRRREQNNHGTRYVFYEAYLGTNPFTKKPVRKYAKTESRLKEVIRTFYAALERGGTPAAILTPAQLFDAQEAFSLIAQSRIKLSLADCARIVLCKTAPDWQPPPAPSSQASSLVPQMGAMHLPNPGTSTLGEAFAKYSKAVEDKSEAYRRDIQSRIGKWLAVIGNETPLSCVTAVGVKQYLMDHFYKHGDVGSWVTYNNHLGNIKTFMSWCASIEQGLIPANPLEGMKKLTIPYRQPDYLKAEDVRKMFNLLWERRNDPMWAADLAYATLSFFCGMRQSEIERVRLGEGALKISLDERFIRVGLPKGVSKGIRPRTFTIPDQALAWMRAFDFTGAVMRKNTRFRRHLTWVAEDADIKMPKNVGRHTFITMFEAVHHNESALTAIVGNTDDVRAKSYNGVELKREGEAYFSILPPI